MIGTRCPHTDQEEVSLLEGDVASKTITATVTMRTTRESTAATMPVSTTVDIRIDIHTLTTIPIQIKLIIDPE
jgi:hypothetical protein